MGKAHFSIFGFPVRIEISALFIAVFIGYQVGSDAFMLIGTFFVSILLHELGHAVAFRRYGSSSFISIHGMGGTTTSFDSQRLTDRQHIIVSLAGPLSQLFLLGIPAIIGQLIYGPAGQLGFFLRVMVFINAGWALINLVPLYPLDGGQVLLRVLRVRNARDPWRVTQIVTVAVGVPLAFLAYQRGYQFGAFIIGYMILRGTMSPPPGSSSIQVAAQQAQADHRRTNITGPGRDAAIRQAYECLLDGNTMRLQTLTGYLQGQKNRATLVTLKQWEELINSQPGPTQQAAAHSGAQSQSDILRATSLTVSGATPSSTGIGQQLLMAITSPELLPAVVILDRNQKLEEALSTIDDDGLAEIRDALVSGGLPQQQMAVSRMLRLRGEVS